MCDYLVVELVLTLFKCEFYNVSYFSCDDVADEPYICLKIFFIRKSLINV